MENEKLTEVSKKLSKPDKKVQLAETSESNSKEKRKNIETNERSLLGSGNTFDDHKAHAVVSTDVMQNVSFGKLENSSKAIPLPGPQKPEGKRPILRIYEEKHMKDQNNLEIEKKSQGTTEAIKADGKIEEETTEQNNADISTTWRTYKKILFGQDSLSNEIGKEKRKPGENTNSRTRLQVVPIFRRIPQFLAGDLRKLKIQQNNILRKSKTEVTRNVQEQGSKSQTNIEHGQVLIRSFDHESENPTGSFMPNQSSKVLTYCLNEECNKDNLENRKDKIPAGTVEAKRKKFDELYKKAFAQEASKMEVMKKTTLGKGDKKKTTHNIGEAAGQIVLNNSDARQDDQERIAPKSPKSENNSGKGGRANADDIECSFHSLGENSSVGSTNKERLVQHSSEYPRVLEGLSNQARLLSNLKSKINVAINRGRSHINELQKIRNNVDEARKALKDFQKEVVKFKKENSTNIKRTSTRSSEVQTSPEKK